ncbi:MAG: asparagine synthetase B, partial [Firmicutes bacterium]|nr:asparagine synthetase B [Bacillota bacterium]
MCGISGILYFDRRHPDLASLRAMCKQMIHRGPDDEGFFTGPGVGLGFRRLSIIDPEGGQQPVASEDG